MEKQRTEKKQKIGGRWGSYTQVLLHRAEGV